MRASRLVKRIFVSAALVLSVSCASVPMAPPEQDAASKTFAAPPPDQAGLYVYRDSSFGAALTKDLFLDGLLVGPTAAKVFYRRLIAPGEHTLSTESEFGDNALTFTAEAGKNHFFRQFVKVGVFVGGAGLEAVSEEAGRKGVLACKEALGVASPASTDGSPPEGPPPSP